MDQRKQHRAATGGNGLGDRASPFGYECRACSRCCFDKQIQVNPFEIAALAEHLGIDSDRFRHEYTKAGAGTHLARREDGACTLLGPAGCSVHPARPLVCRLYPLGRVRHADGSEDWQRLEPHPRSGGNFTDSGNIAVYLDEQQALPWMAAADGYADWVNRARTIIAEQSHAGRRSQEADILPEIELLDLNRATRAWCRANGRAWPSQLEERWKVHLELLHDQLDQLEGKSNEAKTN